MERWGIPAPKTPNAIKKCACSVGRAAIALQPAPAAEVYPVNRVHCAIRSVKPRGYASFPARLRTIADPVTDAKLRKRRHQAAVFLAVMRLTLAPTGNIAIPQAADVLSDQ